MNRVLFASLTLLFFLTNNVSAKEINSKEEYDKVLKNRNRLTQRYDGGLVLGPNSYVWNGDGFTLYENIWGGGRVESTFICINDTDTAQTCWKDNGQEWKRHWAFTGGTGKEWLFDGPDPSEVVFIRKRWPGESAPDLFK